MANNSRRPSLDALAATLTANQASGTTNPREPSQQITVDNEAGIQVGGTSGDSGQSTQLAQDTYSSLSSAECRLDKERRIVKAKLPSNARAHKTDEGIDGWTYFFDCEFGQRYLMFLYFDGAYYQNVVVSPRVEKYWKSPHTGHIYSDGRICMSAHYGGGQPTLDGAYAKSVVWGTGFTGASRFGIPFPFNYNQ